MIPISSTAVLATAVSSLRLTIKKAIPVSSHRQRNLSFDQRLEKTPPFAKSRSKKQKQKTRQETFKTLALFTFENREASPRFIISASG